MRKIERQLSLLILILLMVVTGCKGPVTEPLKQNTLIVEDINGINLKELNQYDMDIVFIPEKAMIEGHQTISYRNNEQLALDKIYFHLYPNVFREEKTAPFLFDDFNRAYPDGFQPGYIDIYDITLEKQEAFYQIMGEGNSILEISLPKPLLPEERVVISMGYTVKLPPAQERFGYGENTFNFGNWYPVAAVYDEKGWNLDPYYPIGDPFYSDVSNYHVKIETPKDMVVAASGNIFRDIIQEESRIWEIEAKLMRDFAWVVSKDFEVVEKDVEGTVLKMYFIKDKTLKKEIKDWATQAAESSLIIFNRTFGKYPYGQYSVVQTNFPSGMEYPGIVFIGKQYYDMRWKNYLEVVIVHETAHQWWYGIVGNDQIEEAWLDESLAAYSEVVYYMEKNGADAGQQYHTEYNEEEYKLAEGEIKDSVILKPLPSFRGWNDYGPLVYSRGAMFLNEIYQEYGQETLYGILQEYYQKNRFHNATTKDFQEAAETITGKDMTALFQSWLLAQ
ncbi:MAG: M1 family metallopeptidase [Thermotaleaceae bacterium]